jgi:5,10-methylenetetrahydrofolate reductase
VTEPDPKLVREFMVISRLREPGDMREVTPPEVRFFKAYYPAHVEREAEEAARRAESERRAAESRESARRIEAHKKLMRDMREWGPKNGFFVGTRGRIPRRVVEAYNEAKGLT